MPTKLDVINLVVVGSVLLEVTSVIVLGVLYSTYARFAQTGDSGDRPPVLSQLRIVSYAVLGSAVLSALTVILGVWWMFGVQDWLFAVAVVLFVLGIVIIPLLVVWLVFNLFK